MKGIVTAERGLSTVQSLANGLHRYGWPYTQHLGGRKVIGVFPTQVSVVEGVPRGNYDAARSDDRLHVRGAVPRSCCKYSGCTCIRIYRRHDLRSTRTISSPRWRPSANVVTRGNYDATGGYAFGGVARAMVALQV